MSNRAETLIKLLCFTDALCEFADSVTEYHDCQFELKINEDKFKFYLPELVAEVQKCRQVILDDIGNTPTDKQDEQPSADKPKSILDEPFVPEFTTKKTSSDEITMSDFDDVRKDMPDPVKTIFNLMLPLSIIEEAKAHEKATEPMPKEKRIKAIEMHTMLRLAQIAVS